MTETTSHLEHIDDLVYLSHSVSSQAICGEGNVSMRGDDGFYIKASGTTLEDLKWEDTVYCNFDGSA